jgi:hypothetical protein
MTLTRDFRETVQRRFKRDEKFREALVNEHFVMPTIELHERRRVAEIAERARNHDQLRNHETLTPAHIDRDFLLTIIGKQDVEIYELRKAIQKLVSEKIFPDNHAGA